MLKSYHSLLQLPTNSLMLFGLVVSVLLLPFLLLMQWPVVKALQTLVFYLSPLAIHSPALALATEQSYQLALTGQGIENSVLTHVEKAHLLDVFAYVFWLKWLGVLIIIYLGFIWFYRPPLIIFTRVQKLLFLALLTWMIGLLFFNSLFVWMHPWLFPQGNWQFPSASWLIQAFPLPFWLGMGIGYGLLLLVEWGGLWHLTKKATTPIFTALPS